MRIWFMHICSQLILPLTTFSQTPLIANFNTDLRANCKEKTN